jgi:dipeptidyl aminopeptidase/acylaminoacyl peptidase
VQFAAIILALFLSSVAAAAAPAGESLRPVTHEDLWTMRRLGTPVTSPDGKWAVVAVTEPAYKEEETVSDLWLVAVDGKTEPRRLTATKDAARASPSAPSAARTSARST